MAKSQLVTVYAAQGMLPAQVARAKLEASGIPCLLKYEAVGQLLGLTVDGLGRVEVQVPPEWADAALELLVESGEDYAWDADDASDEPLADA
jgi:hypothetical protein